MKEDDWDMNKIFIIPERLIKCRMEKGLSQRKLAALAGLSPATISNLENNMHAVSEHTLKMVSEVLEVTLSYLCGTEEQDAEPNSMIMKLKHSTNIVYLIKLIYDIQNRSDEDLKFITEYIKICIKELDNLKWLSFFNFLYNSKHMSNDMHRKVIKINKENFLDHLKNIDMKQINSFIERKGKSPKRIPLMVFYNEDGTAKRPKM